MTRLDPPLTCDVAIIGGGLSGCAAYDVLRDSGLRVIRTGLNQSDRIVIGGIQRVRNGSMVAPVEGAIGDDGTE